MNEHAPLTHLADDPERYYTYSGRVSHLITYGTDLNNFPYTPAWCGREPAWPTKWLGTGNQSERDKAASLPICKLCMTSANEIRRFVDDLKDWVER